MPVTFRRSFAKRTLQGCVVVLVFGFLLGGRPNDISEQSWLWMAAFAVVILVAGISAIRDADRALSQATLALEADRSSLVSERDSLLREKNVTRAAIRERAMGLPTLVGSLDEYFQLQDAALASTLMRKSHPAFKAAEVVRAETKKRRIAERAAISTKSILDYYESVAPFLADLREELSEEDDEASQVWMREYDEQERSDVATRYLTKDEYRNLTSEERNQRALDRYWQRSHSNLEIGRMYERYAGYLFEQDGYDVEYHGILKGLEDLGRDLICTKGAKILVVQCKHWSQHKTIHEKHVFQLFGSMFLYRREHPEADVQGLFMTSTSLSPIAREAADFLKIHVRDGHGLDGSYPAIKCNIGRSGERIYHLPFDQQYDSSKIGAVAGEKYCRTVSEAETAGFRRAFRYRGDKTQ